MVERISYFYEYLVFFYGFFIIICTLMLTYLSYLNIKKHKWLYNKRKEDILKESPYLPGISVIAPAYNEATTIITNVHSMLTLDYPLFEVIIVNDGSTDQTLDLLIEEFQLVETPFAYIEKIKTKPFRRIFKSTNQEYGILTVVDKENGGTKADGTNAGINASVFPYFLCTDVDCILSRDVLTKMMLPILNSTKQVIAVGATLRMANSCEIEQGVIKRARPPRGNTSCGCILVDESSFKVLPSGGKGFIILKYDSGKNVGYVKQYVTILANLEEKGMYEVTFDVNVVPNAAYTRDYEEIYNDKKEKSGGIKTAVDGRENRLGYYTDNDLSGY
ncbi:glycosyltransferase [Bacteroides sp. 519]|uniref:glycosyltransferase n=1 Tax=Bacteroides sp. 519 TaxID=2302937 RepID=UPI0013D09D3F|nr:glycosyltransferase [Bacteroides sp. 519]NDV58079.1 glycosyltransferase [Bacteroides sp. 519]